MKVHYPKLNNMAHLSLNVLMLPKDLTIIFYFILNIKALVAGRICEMIVHFLIKA